MNQIKSLKPDLIKIIQILRNREINLYDVKLNKADAQFEFLKQCGKEFQNLIVVQTKGDGNCFYNAISLCLFGSQEYCNIKRLGTAFIFVENEQYMRNLISSFYGEKKLNQFLVDISKNYNWANEYEIHAMSIALNRAINVFSVNEVNKIFLSMNYYAHDCQLKKKCVSIVHRKDHFSALMPISFDVKFPNISGNQFYKYKIKTFKNYE
jgi:hypothetical protein